MKDPYFITTLTILLFVAASTVSSTTTTQEDNRMIAKGKFEVNLELQKDEDAPAGRMVINKTYSGDIIGTGTGQMISKRLENGSAVYYAIEEFTGEIAGKTGSFTLVHNGAMDKQSQSLDIKILEGSGTGELETISGTMDIIQEGGSHSYELRYQL